MPCSYVLAGIPRVRKDGNGQKLACVYYEDEPGRRSAAKLPSKDKAIAEHELAWRSPQT